jgi:predicted MFS family arabinose efflux permease
LLGLAEFAPAVLLVLVTGAVADHFDRRIVAALGAAGEALAAVGLAWFAISHGTGVAPIFVLVVVFGTARAFAAPAARSMPADLVSSDRLPWVVARMSGTWQAALIVGPVLGGALYVIDPAAPYIGMAVLLLAATVAIMAVPVAPDSPAAIIDDPVVDAGVEPVLGHGAATVVPRPTLHDALEGLRFIRRQPVLLGAISLDLFAVLFGGAIALLPAIAEDRLGVGAVGLGWLRAAGGIGAAATTLVLARRPLQHAVGRVLLIAVAVFGLGTLVLGVTRSYVLAFIAMAVLSGADAISVFVRATLVPLVTPSDKRGRVLAVENVFIGASNELGAFESGVAGQLIGTSGAVIFGGAATLAVAATWWLAFPALRDVDRFPDSVNID